MTQVTYTDHTGTPRTVVATAGDSVMETAVRNGVPGIVAECGGSLSCATCHVFVAPDDLAGLPAMVTTYAVDSYKPVAGPLMVAITVNKNLWGYGFAE